MIIPSQLWNNIATVCYSLKLYDQAEQGYLNSLTTTTRLYIIQVIFKQRNISPEQQQEVSKEDFQLIACDVTIVYNLALNCYKKGLYQISKQLHQLILKFYPNYHDCIIRQAIEAVQQGKIKDALTLLNKVATIILYHNVYKLI